MTNLELDRRILASCETRWLKVARVLGEALKDAGLEDKEWRGRAATKRLRVLLRKGQLEAAGNIWNWRASEARLLDASERVPNL